MNFGSNFQTLIQEQVGYLFLAILGAVAVYFLVKREFSKFIGFILFAMVVAVFVFAPDFIKDLGISVVKKIFG